MDHNRLLPLAIAVITACSPSPLIVLPDLDAGERADAASDRTNIDVPADATVPLDAPIIDITVTDTALSPDSPGVQDVVSPLDVITTTDAPPVDDALDAGVISDTAVIPDAGRCPSGMVFVPAGQFMMGDLMSDNPDARPVHGVRLTEFCLDESPVTIAAYQACVTAGVCTAPATTASCNWGVTGREQHPANCTNWNQARTYCQWRGGDLPTEARWEYAARGMDGRTYPWGNDEPSSQLCWNGGGARRESTCAVGAFRSGHTPSGLSDMAGNVWEWTLDWYGVYPVVAAGTYALNPVGPASGTGRVVRGASWFDASPRNFRAASRSYYAPGAYSQYHGFRCAR